WEWARLCRGGRTGTSGAVLVATVVIAVVTAALAPAAVAITLAGTGAALVFWTARRQHEQEAYWLALGTAWLALPCILLLWLARAEGAGRLTLLWIFAVVWATDIGAYVVGRQLGGPRLAP